MCILFNIVFVIIVINIDTVIIIIYNIVVTFAIV